MTPDWLAEVKDRDAAVAAVNDADDNTRGAVVAGCALMAAAEGADDAGIRRRLNAALGGTGGDFDRTLERLRGDAAVADEEALAAVRAVKGDAAAAQRVARACCALASADGDLLPAQANTARRICEALNLSPTQFGL